MTVRLQAGWTYLDGRLQSGLALELDAGGRIEHVLEVADGAPAELRNVALFPGFVNAHSHAFQWGLRGLVQRAAHASSEPGAAGALSSSTAGASETFFSWRDRMFALVDQLEPESLHGLSRRAFAAMRAAGYTSVGEFHYVHHGPGGEPYARSTTLAEAVLEAARAEGLRVCLLHAAYLRPSGVAAHVADGQRRFLDPDVESFLARHTALEAVVASLGDPSVSMGVAPHSIRTVPAASLARLAQATRGPLHLHINEQRRELEESLAEYGVRPLDVVERAGALGPRTTLVHMTHASDDEVWRAATMGAAICFCPTTERDLGDGIGPSLACARADVNLAIGSDSQVQLDPFEELRLLEGHERLRSEARLLLPPAPGGTLAERLLDVGSRGGAASLQLHTGRLAPGAFADLVALDLDDPDLAGFEPERVPDVAVFGASPRAVVATFVAGRRRPGAALGSWDA